MEANISERRTAPRQKAFLRGKLYYSNRLNVADCLIRDMSDQGARVIVSDALALPDELELHVLQKDQNCLVRVVWRRGQEMGLAFVRAVQSQPDELTARLARLEEEIANLKRIVKKLKVEAGPDAEVA